MRKLALATAVLLGAIMASYIVAPHKARIATIDNVLAMSAHTHGRAPFFLEQQGTSAAVTQANGSSCTANGSPDCGGQARSLVLKAGLRVVYLEYASNLRHLFANALARPFADVSER